MAEIQLTIRKNLEGLERRLTGVLIEKFTDRKLSCLVEDPEDLD